LTEPGARPAEGAADAEARRREAAARIMDDYRDDAVVNDPLFGKPLVGRAAIGTHKLAEMIALTEVSFEVTERWAQGSRLFANWEVTGTHSGPYYDIPPTGNRIVLQGSTIVTRVDGKIAEETLFYDAREMLRQLEGREEPQPSPS
jgi:predicted ester cyclase